MRGVLWRWLFGLGALFWVGLCLADYHQKRLKKAFTLVESLEAEMPAPPPILMEKRDGTPALTFWKWISMILSVSALVYIKRSSRIRPDTGTSVSGRGRKSCRNSRPASPSRLTKLQEHYSWRPKSGGLRTDLLDSVPQALIGVQLVQQRLENLEQNIASLKHRIINTSTYPNITSGPQALQNFIVSKWKSISRSQMPSTTSIDSDSVSMDKLNIPGIPHLSDSVGSDSLASVSNADEIKEIIKGYTESELLDEINRDVITDKSSPSDNYLTCHYASEEELSLELSEMSSSKSSTNTDTQNPTEDWDPSEPMSTTSSIQAIKLAGPIISDHGFASCDSLPSVRRLLTKNPDNLVVTYMKNMARKTGESSSGVSSITNIYSDKYGMSKSREHENRNNSGTLQNKFYTLLNNWRY